MVEGAMWSRGTAVETTASRSGASDQHVIGRAGAVAAIDAETGRGVALRIEIDDQDALADCSECRAKVDRCGCFSHTTLLIRQRQDARVAMRDFRLLLGGLVLLRLVSHGHRNSPTQPLNAHPRRSTEASSTIQPSPVRLWWSCG
jgi:hypothetical protein